MNITKTISGLLLLLFCTQTGFAQSNNQFSLNKLIVGINENIEFEYDSAGVLSSNNERFNYELNRIGYSKIKRLLKTKQKIENEPFVVEFNHNTDIEWAVEMLSNSSVFTYAEPNYYVEAFGKCDSLPNDQFLSRQYAVKNVGSAIGAVIGADIDLDLAWAISTGSKDVVVSTLDTGLKLDHPEFNGRLWVNTQEIPNNNIDDDGNGYIDDINGYDIVNNDSDPTDDQGHGTAVTGVMAANANNAIGYAGVDWNCRLMTTKVLANWGGGSVENVAEGIYYSVLNGADIINMSLGGISFSAALQNAVTFAKQSNVLVVVAMGNYDTETKYYPAACIGAFSVGATGSNNRRVSRFNSVWGSNYGNHIDITAPGNDIYCLKHTSDTAFNYKTGGTSLSTPFVSGLAALIKGIDPKLTALEIKQIITTTAMDQVGRKSEDTPGWDKYHGYGVINAHKALMYAIAIDTFSCANIFSMGTSYLIDSSGLYLDSALGSKGCDSLFYIKFTKGVKVTKKKMNACSNIASPSGREIWKNSGVYYDTINSMSSCDSIIEIHLNIERKYNAIDTTICDSLIATSGKKIWGDSGVYYDTITTSAGCDSITIYNLWPVSVNANVIKDGSCAKGRFEINNGYLWLDCNKNFRRIVGVNSPVYCYTNTFYPSHVALEVTKSGCKDTSNCVQLKSTISVNSINNNPNPFKVFPNPNSGKFTIQSNLNQEIPFEIIASDGQMIQRGVILKDQTVDLNSIYGSQIVFLKTYWNNQIHFEPIVISN